MQKKQFRADRLSKLAYHLIRHQHKLAKYSCIHVPLLDAEDVQCESTPYFLYPLQEIVRLFPRQWFFDKNGFAFWIQDKSKVTSSSTMNFFGFGFSIFCHLFIPDGQNVGVFGGKRLTPQSTPNDIAENMLALIEAIEIQKN